MKHSFRLLTVMLLLVTSCAAPRTMEHVSYHKLGVISLAGPIMQAKYNGLMVFGNEGWDADTGSMAISDFTRDEIARTLNERGYDAKPLSVDARAWAARYQKGQEDYGTRVAEAYGSNVATELYKTELKSLISQNQLDAIGLFVPGRDGFHDTGEWWIGVGDHGFGFVTERTDQTRGYIMGFLYIIDGKTLETTARIQLQAFAPKETMAYPTTYQALNQQTWAAMQVAMKNAFSAKLREEITAPAAKAPKS